VESWDLKQGRKTEQALIIPDIANLFSTLEYLAK
jgi:hypothetical protein